MNPVRTSLAICACMAAGMMTASAQPVAENIARLIYDFARTQGFPVVEVQLWETEHCFASYARP